MNFTIESLKEQIPFYLTSEDKDILVREINSIANGSAKNVDFSLPTSRDDFSNDILQGDGWKGFILYNFDTGDKKNVKGMVLSNSCDVDPANKRDTPSRIIFSPLVKLDAFRKMLVNSGIDEDVIDSKIKSIKSQKTTSIFYIPLGGGAENEYIIRFDDAYSMPVEALHRNDGENKVFTLNNTGFYMLLLKLSIHFCRFQEKINRGSAALQV